VCPADLFGQGVQHGRRLSFLRTRNCNTRDLEIVRRGALVEVSAEKET